MVGFSLSTGVDRANKMLKRMVDPKYVTADKAIPRTLIRHCEGIAFITIIKAGLFVLGGNIGGGIVIAKVPDANDPRGWRWSGPSAVTCGGLGGGFIFGGEKIDSVIVLNTKSAVRAFMGNGQVTFGGNLSVAAGPVGREIEGHIGLSDTKEILAAYSYSQTQGAMIAATLEGAFVVASKSANYKFYNDKNAEPEAVLTGKISIPLKAKDMIARLDEILSRKKQPNEQSYSIAKKQDIENKVEKQIAENGKRLLNAGLSGDNDLPLGWSEATAPNGDTYYYNGATNTTQWERPKNDPAAIAASRPVPPIPPKRPTIPARAVFAEAMYDYDARRSDELSFKEKDKIRITDKSDDSWWTGELNGIKGLVPANYVKL